MIGYIRIISRFIKEEALYYLLTFCLFSSSIVPFFSWGRYLYFVSLLLIAVYSIKNSVTHVHGTLFFLFLAACLLSCLLNVTFDYRFWAFVGLVIVLTPITCSWKLYGFRRHLLFAFLMLFPLCSLLAVYCFFTGINYFGENPLDFSAFFPHPMWLAAAVGIANIVFLWLMYSTRYVLLKVLFGVALLVSLYLSVVAASRSALIASILAMLILVVVRAQSWRKILQSLAMIAVVCSVLFPTYIVASKRIQSKFENPEGVFASRRDIFTNGFEHFYDSPLCGAGFAVGYNAENQRVVGRMESGSGWLSILFQVGIVGFVVMFVILYRLRRIYPFLRKDRLIQLYVSVFLFLCFHSGFEGYLLTVGYYLGPLFWLLLGYLYVTPDYQRLSFAQLKKRDECNDTRFLSKLS